MVCSQPALSLPLKRHADGPKIYSQTCLGHIITQPKLQLLLESLIDDKQVDKDVFHTSVSNSKQWVICTSNFVLRGNTSMEKMVFSN